VRYNAGEKTAVFFHRLFNPRITSFMFKVIIETGRDAGQTFEVKDRATLGRLKGNEISVSDPGISRQHARLLVQSGRLLLKDLGSANGTFLNESKVDSAEVRSGDRIRLGSIQLRVEEQEGLEEQTETALAPPGRPAPPPASDRLGSGADAAAAGFDIRKREKILQFSPHARAPKEESLLRTDLDQRSGLFKLGVAAVLIVIMVLIILFSGKVVDWLIPGPQPTVEEESYEESP